MRKLIATLTVLFVFAFGAPASALTYNVTDHGGPVLNHTVNLHLLFWGPDAAFDPNEKQDVTDFVAGYPGSGQQHLLDEYMRGLEPSVVLVDVKSDQQMPAGGKSKGSQLQTELHKMWPTGDPNGLYLVVSANYGWAGANAWHDSAVVSGQAVPVVYIPDQTARPGSPSPAYFWDQWIDADVPGGKTSTMVTLLAHEIAEASTNPFTACPLYCNEGFPVPPLANPAWYDPALDDGEIADWCGYSYTVSGTWPNLAYQPHYAVMSNGQRFVIGGLWEQSLQACAWS